MNSISRKPIEGLKLLVAAFGNPKSEKTFSMVPKYLCNALEKHIKIVAYLSTKQLRPLDVFDGAIDFSKTLDIGRPGISRKWLWRQNTVDKLSVRFKELLYKVGDFNAVLQIGTHVRLALAGVRHYCQTDVTVVQAAKAGCFGMDKLGSTEIKEAIAAQKGIFESSENIFAASRWVKQSIVNDYGIDESKIHIIGVGASVSTDIDINHKQPNFNILFVGRDWKRKGGPILLDAFRKVVRRIPEARLTIIGCTPKISEENVKVLGYLNKNDHTQSCIIRKAYQNATVLCVPSLFEPFGICFLEAQFHGVVPVTFTGEGRCEAIKDGLTGVLVEERNSEVLSRAIIELLEKPTKTKQMGIAGRKFILDNYTWDHVAKRILKIIEADKFII